MLKIQINGKFQEVESGTTLIELLKQLDLPSIEFGIAASVNGMLIDREHWQTTTLMDTDNVEIIRAFQGG